VSYKARFEILTLGLLNIEVFSDVTPCQLVNVADVSKDRNVFTFKLYSVSR